MTACPTGIDIALFVLRISTGMPGGGQDHLRPQHPGRHGARRASLPARRPHRQARRRRGSRTRGAGLRPSAGDEGPRRHPLRCAPQGGGGLDEFGIAGYKTVDRFAEREVEWLLGIGGITMALGRRLGGDLTLDGLVRDYDAVFLGLGLGAVNALGVDEEATENVRDAIDFIAELRRVEDLSTLPAGRRVVVIGGGMTAVDAAVQSKLLGAEEVAMVYRRWGTAPSARWSSRTRRTAPTVCATCS